MRADDALEIRFWARLGKEAKVEVRLL